MDKLKEYRFDSEGRLRMNKNRLRIVAQDANLHRRQTRWISKLINELKVKQDEDGN